MTADSNRTPDRLAAGLPWPRCIGGATCWLTRAHSGVMAAGAVFAAAGMPDCPTPEVVLAVIDRGNQVVKELERD